MPILMFATVVLPILAGLSLLLLKIVPERIARGLVFAITVLTSLGVLGSLLLEGGQALTVIRFSDVLSFSLKNDGLGRFFAGMVAFLWPFATLYSFVYMKHASNRLRYDCFYLMTYGVVLGVAFAENAVSLYVFFEMLTFITLPLITHTETKEARRAGRLYLYYSLSGSSLALAGVVMMTVFAGSNAFVPGGHSVSEGVLVFIGYLFTFIGFGVKAALFPFCGWLPAASAAPTPTTALLHSVAVVKSGAFAVLRMTYYFFPTDLLRGSFAQAIAIALAAMTVVWGSCMAVKEQHFKRRFAYSTVSNLSYILLGAALATPAGLVAALLHFLMHSITKIGVFFSIGAMMETNEITYIYELNGMGRKTPILFTCFTISGLSLIGVPPFSGFVSKFNLLSSFLSFGGAVGWVSTGAVILSAILSAVYVLSVSFRVFAKAPSGLSSSAVERSVEPSRGFLLIIGFFAICSLLFGLVGGLFESVAQSIAGGIAV